MKLRWITNRIQLASVALHSPLTPVGAPQAVIIHERHTLGLARLMSLCKVIRSTRITHLTFELLFLSNNVATDGLANEIKLTAKWRPDEISLTANYQAASTAFACPTLLNADELILKK